MSLSVHIFSNRAMCSGIGPAPLASRTTLHQYRLSEPVTTLKKCLAFSLSAFELSLDPSQCLESKQRCNGVRDCTVYTAPDRRLRPLINVRVVTQFSTPHTLYIIIKYL